MIKSNLLKNRLMTFSFILSVAWIFGIAIFSYADFELLLFILEKIFSVDGHITLRNNAVIQVMIAPLAVLCVFYAFLISAQRRTLTLSFLPLNLVVFFTHLTFYYCYTIFFLKANPLEGGMLEVATFILAATASILFFVSGILGIRFALLLGLCWLFFAFEEVSWGQSFFHSASSKFFIENNLQQETNIHNFFSNSLLAYISVNIVIFLAMTWGRKIQYFSTYYKIKSVSFVVRVSDKYSLWFYPLILCFASIYPGAEFVEEHWSIFGVLFSLVLLRETIENRDSHRTNG
jgi:hypothetical protein